MAKLSIDELDLSPALREMVKEAAAAEGKQQAIIFIDEYKKQLEQPVAMNYTQAAKCICQQVTTHLKSSLRAA
ncbi:DNA-binding protein [Enterococcus devriesei]|nr:DNA-binding protein [Enterococcus devriesei]